MSVSCDMLCRESLHWSSQTQTALANLKAEVGLLRAEVAAMKSSSLEPAVKSGEGPAAQSACDNILLMLLSGLAGTTLRQSLLGTW